MQDVRRKPPIKYNKDGSVSLDGSGVKILRLLEPQGEPDVIECDGMRYVPERTCRYTWCLFGDLEDPLGCYQAWDCSCCGEVSEYLEDVPSYCPNCGAKVVE